MSKDADTKADTDKTAKAKDADTPEVSEADLESMRIAAENANGA